jgi:lysophospholipase L1-like esterase
MARETLGRVALVIASVAAALAVGELGLRVAGVAPARFGRCRTVENRDKSAALDLYPTNPRGYFDVDLRDGATRARFADLGLETPVRTPFGIALRYNADRCRDLPRTLRTRDATPRVLVIGDSFTEGEGVREEDTFVRRSAQKIGTRIEIINCGRRGRDFPELRDAFERLVDAYQPDVVVYAMVLNDAVQSQALHDRQRFLNDWIVDRRRMLPDGGDAPRGSRLLALVEDRLEAARVARETTRWYRDLYGSVNRDGWDATQRHLAAMDAEMRARGGRFVVALLPLIVGLDGEYPFMEAHREIARACAALGVELHDLLPSLRGQAPASLWVHPVDLHPNERAHALIAEALAPIISRAASAPPHRAPRAGCARLRRRGGPRARGDRR